VPLKMGRSNVAFKREYEKHIKDIRSEFNWKSILIVILTQICDNTLFFLCHFV
jgi:hypothetical protein